MAQTIKLKRSATQNAVPSTSSLALGEIAINTYDGKLFIKKNDGSESIVTIGTLENNAVTSAKIAANAVTSSEIAKNAVGTSEIAANSVGISELNVSDGNNGQVLTTNGSGTLSFTSKTATAQSFYLNTATGDGNSTDFTLSTTPAAESYIIAFIDGVFQNQDSYTFSGTTLTFDTAPPNGSTVTVYVVGSIYSGNSVVLDTFSGDDSETAFTLSENPQSENNTQVYIDGVYQQKSEYSVSGTTLTFSSAPPTGTSNIEVIMFSSTNFSVLNANSVTSASIASGAVNTVDIADNAITSAKIASGVIVASDVADNSITSAKIALNAVGASELASGALNGQTFTGDSEITGEFTASEFIGDLRGPMLFKAQAGEALSKGDVVYISGISGNTTVVSKADADDSAKMPAFGIAAAAASANASVDIYTQGILTNLDTSSYSEGDELFVSTTAGALTDTAPTGETSLLQKIAKVTRSDNSAGSIFITGAGRTNAVPNLDEDQFFLGNASNQAVATDFSDAVESYLDGGTSTPTFSTLAAGNTTLTGYLRGPSSFTIDPATHGNDTGTVVIAGNLQVDGTTTTINSTTLTVDDKLVTLASGSINAAAADGAGIEVEISGATNPSITYDGTNDEWDFNKDITTTGYIGAGTSNPANLLHLESSGSDYATIRLNAPSNTTPGQFLLRAHDGVFDIRNANNSTTDLTIDASGNVGIGTSSPTFTSGGGLQIYNAGQANLRISDSTNNTDFSQSGADTYIINRVTSGDIKFRVNGSTELITIDGGTGSVGISNSQPSSTYKLDVSGAVRSSTTAPSFNLQETDASNQHWALGSYAGVFGLRDVTGTTYPLQIEQAVPTNTLYLDSTGNVGIGTSTSFNNKLEVSGGDIRVRDTSTPSLKLNNGDQEVVGIRLKSGASGVLSFHTDKMVIDTSGNVGISRTSPQSTLHIYGAAQNVANLTDSGNTGAMLKLSDSNTTAGSGGAILFSNSQADNQGSLGVAAIKSMLISGAGNTIGNLVFSLRASINDTNLAERMRLDYNGNLIIGGTASQANNATTINSTGLVYSSKNGDVSGHFNRQTSDGDIVKLSKDGTTVGSIGTYSSRLYLGTGDTGVFFDSITNDAIKPWNTSTNAGRDAAIDLGGSSERFKDFYLSGDITIGSEKKIWSGSYGGALEIKGDNATSNRYIKLKSVDSTGADISGAFITLKNLYTGIGFETPACRLSVFGDGDSTSGHALNLSAGNSSTNFNAAQVIFSYDGGQFNSYGYSHSIRSRHNGGASRNNALDFYLWKYGTDSDSTLGSMRVMELENSGTSGELKVGTGVLAETYNPLVAGVTSDALVAGRHASSGSLGLWRTNTMEFKYYHNGQGYIMTFGSNGVISGDFNDTSDRNLKENITDLNGGLSVITQLRPRNFDWKKEAKANGVAGFIAQEVEEILPNEVFGNDYVEPESDLPEDVPADNGKHLNYNGILAHAVKAIQELNAKLEAAEARITELEG